MLATTIAVPNHIDAEKDAWIRSVLGVDVAGDGPVPGKGAHTALAGTPGPGGKVPSPGKSGLNYVTQLVASGSYPIPGAPVGVGGGLGVGYGQNNGKKQYFLVGRVVTSGVPKASAGVSAEFIGSFSPILNRSIPSRTWTASGIPLAKSGTAQMGPVAVDDQLSATGSHFSNKNLGVVFAGVTNTTTLKAEGSGKAALAVAESVQFVKNNRGRPEPTDADALQEATKPLGKRPINTVDKDAPILFSASATVSGINKPGAKKLKLPIQASTTFTVPISDENTPDWIKDLLKRIAAAQRSPNPEVLLRLLRDIEASPQLQKRLLDWELQELKHIPAPHPIPTHPQVPHPVPAPHPVLVPDPGWATRVGHSLQDAASNWRPPTPAQQAEVTLGAALAALGAFIIAKPEVLLVVAL